MIRTVGEMPISNISNNKITVQNKNGNNLQNGSITLKEINDVDNSNDEERKIQMVKECSSDKDSKNAIENEPGKATYAEVLLKGTKKEKRKVRFKV